MKQIVIFLLGLCSLQAQDFSRADSLRGALSSERSWFDVHYYHLDLELNIQEKSISGSNTIAFSVLKSSNRMQLDLFANMSIDSVIYQGNICEVTREFNAFFVEFPKPLVKGLKDELTVFYHGIPRKAKRAPWDGGFVWKEDEQGLPWIGVACQGMGASAWWPCKDHLSDEPDSMRITCSVPENIQFVGNGNLEEDVFSDGRRVSTWKVSYPINTYNVTLNVANYSHLQDVYVSNTDSLALDYYILTGNEEKARKQFEQVKPMLAIYEDLFGPYPFWEDGYALVETPYLGMEHQSAIAYGNQYLPGYLGRYPGDMDFDFIVIHESGHEYWGNSVSMNDLADMWIHESFCTYTEALFVEQLYGYDSMIEYLLYQRGFIDGRSPILGHRDVNNQGNHTDMYYKGSWMLHSIRNTIDNDSLWFSIIKGISYDFALENCDGVEIIDYVCEKAGMDLKPIFEQYLAYSKAPKFEYKLKHKSGGLQLKYRWRTEVEGFNMSMKYKNSDGNWESLYPSTKWQIINIENLLGKSIQFSDHLYLVEKI
jgi:aminopeptidase N